MIVNFYNFNQKIQTYTSIVYTMILLIRFFNQSNYQTNISKSLNNRIITKFTIRKYDQMVGCKAQNIPKRMF
jgi:hypothetical protein